MKKLILMALGVVVIQQLAKYFDIKSFSDLKKVSFDTLREYVMPKKYAAN